VSSDATKIRVLVIDDHAVVRVGVRTLVNAEPDMEVVAEAGDAAEALAAYSRHRPDVVLADLRLPDVSGAGLIQQLRRLDPQARIVVLTSYDADEDVYQAVRAGARGYLLKGTFPDGILEAAIRRVHAGEQVLPPPVAALLASREAQPALSPREVAVLELVARGLSNREIGDVLRTSAGTVKTHLKRIFVKLGVGDRTEAALIAVQRGLVPLR
jgi:two-component system, NarL family, response regulator